MSTSYGFRHLLLFSLMIIPVSACERIHSGNMKQTSSINEKCSYTAGQVDCAEKVMSATCRTP